MNEEVSNYRQKIQFVTGFAGSGKSTLLADRCDDSVLVLTPTHKAAGVLKAKGINNVYTIHSVLKLVPTINEDFRKGQKLQKLSKVGKVDLSKIKKIAIDEFSMINTTIMDMLLEVLPSHALVMVFGDPYQLPPVDGDPIDPWAYTDDLLELTKQHRAEAPEVVETFMRFMNYIKDGGRGAPDLTFNPAIKQGDLRDFNPATDRALAFTNAKVIGLNNEIAGHLNLPDEISIGEQVLANVLLATKAEAPTEMTPTIFPNCISKGRLMDGDELIVKVDDTWRDINKYDTDLGGYKTAYITIEEETYEIYYDYSHYANSKTLKAKVEEAQLYVIETHGLDEDTHLPTWCKMNRNKDGVRARGEAWSAYIAHQSLVFDLRRPFATTIHKAQGQEFKRVFIAQQDIKRSIRQGYYLQYARLMYVALSRAIEKVVIV